MSQYIGYFFAGLDQWLVLGAVFILWTAMTGIGAVVAGPRRLPEANAYFGWAIISFVVTTVGVTTRISLGWVLLVLGIAAIAAFVWKIKQGDIPFPGSAWKVIVLTVPLLLIVSAMIPSQWDEFSHWLPAPRFLLLTDLLPSAKNPIVGTQMLAAYPWGWTMLSYIVGRIAGQFMDNAGGVLNILFLFAFGYSAIRLAFTAAGKQMPEKLSWPVAALCVMGGTMFNSTFVEKVVLTAYADTTTAVGVALGAILAWRITEALAEKDEAEARALAWQFGLIMVALVNIKQVNLVPFVVLTFATGLVVVRDPAARVTGFLKCLPAMVLPAMSLYLLWRYHVSANMQGWVNAEAGFMPFERWNITVIPQIIWGMLVVAANKGVFFGIMTLATVLAIKGFIKFRGSFDRIALIIAVTFVGYDCFLLLTYIGSFDETSALRVASFWRYNLHVGLLSVVFAAYGVGMFWRKERAVPKAVLYLPVFLVVAAPLVFAKTLRFDYEAPKPHATKVARDLATSFPKDKPLYMLDPTGTGETAVITRYYMNRYTVNYMSAFQDPTQANMESFLANMEPDADLIVHSVNETVTNVLGISLDDANSYLLTRKNGAWEVSRVWPKPDR